MIPQPVQQPTNVVTLGNQTGQREDVLSDKRRKFRAFERNKEREMREQQEARRYYHGRQWTDDEIAVLKRRKQPVVTDNRINRKIDFLVGLEQRQRRDPKAYPRGPGDEASATVATASMRFVCDENRWETTASDACQNGLVTGVGAAWIGIEPGRSGLDVKAKLVQEDRFFYDPRSVRPDFADAKYMGTYLWIDAEDLKAEYPALSGDFEKMLDRDGGLSLLPDTDREQQWGDFEQKRIRVVEMYEKKPMAPAKQGYGWYFCKFAGNVLMEGMWSPYLDENQMPDNPYVAWSPWVDERGDRYGLVRHMRPMQDEINHRRSKLLHRTNVKQMHMREGVLGSGEMNDEDRAREELARPDGILRHNGTWGQDIGLIDQSKEMQGEAALLELAQASLENLGPNPGLIGKGEGVADQSGRAILAQRDSGTIELSPVFDRLRDWKLRCYRKMWNRIRQAWTNERYIRITERDDAPKYIWINQYEADPMTGQITSNNVVGEIDVDIILEEGPDTTIMREEMLQVFTQLGEAAAGPLGKILIELSNMPDKDRMMAMLDKANEPDPMTQELNKRMGVLEAQLKQAQIAKYHADTENTRADAATKLAGAMIPPQALPSVFPIPFDDILLEPDTQGENGPPQPFPQPPMEDPGMMPQIPPGAMPPQEAPPGQPMVQ